MLRRHSSASTFIEIYHCFYSCIFLSTSTSHIMAHRLNLTHTWNLVCFCFCPFLAICFLFSFRCSEGQAGWGDFCPGNQDRTWAGRSIYTSGHYITITY
ncbi:hypothetical protein BJY04DRAFT_87368 [Aspergillus karnatakaensis]|uniref:uncharacterized protein n=1 Tax=Aspergillus karnatakaensis TaxID=1810916 RepID=UPI003CCDBD1A